MSLLDFKQKHGVWIDPVSVAINIILIYVLFLMHQVRDVFVILFLAFILMTALRPWVVFMNTRLKMPKPASIALAYILLISICVLIIGFVVPPLINELYQLVIAFDLPFLNVIQEAILALSLDLSQLNALATSFSTITQVARDVFTTAATGVLTLFTLLVFSIYLMIDRPHLHKKIAWFTKEKKYFDIVEKYLNDLEFQLGGWVRGQILLMFLIGTLTYIGLVLLNVPYALPLALLAGLLEIVPNLGPVVAAIPAILLALGVGGPVLMGITALFYIVMQQLENNLIVPKIMHDSADVNPLVAMVIILIGLTLGNVVGALISVPLYIVFRTTYVTFRRNSN